MTVLGVFVLAAIAAWLWRRVSALERRLDHLERSGIPAVVAAPKGRTAAVAESAPASPHPTTEPVPASTEPRRWGRWKLGIDVEDLFGRLLPIWTGGVALAVAGFFLVRWSIDAGLLTPAVRVALAGLFGAILLAVAEAAYRWRERVADPRVAQALAGAGLATLYAAFYLAGAAYGLIGSTLAFIGLASVTAAAIGLSSRFGLPTAVLGLVGGFAAPALVGSDDANLPLLTIYLALVTGGLALSGRRQNRAWIGVAALAAGLLWGAALLATGPDRIADVAILGVYLVLLGTAVPALFGSSGTLQRALRIGAAGAAALQLAVLVQGGGFGALEWGLYLLLGAALAWYGWREPAMRESSALAAAVAVALLALWHDPDPEGFAVVTAALAALFAGVPLGQLARRTGGWLAVAQTTGVALGLAGVTYYQFGAFIPDRAQPVIALALLALAALPALAARLAQNAVGQAGGRWPVAAQAAAVLLGYGALAQVLPDDSLAWTAAIAAAAVAWLARSLRGAIAALVAMAGAWALAPAGEWLTAGSIALVGGALTVGDLPGIRTVALHLLPAVAAGSAWRLRAPPPGRARLALDLLIAALLIIAAHSVFRHAFAAIAGNDFVATGVLQRAAWEALLAAGAWLCLKRGWRIGATVLAAVAVAHFAWFAVGLHNPLWADQAVGSTPLANALVPAFAAGLLALALVRHLVPEKQRLVRAAVDAAIMATVTLFALAQLRQVHAGTMLTAIPVGPSEDLLRSILGIVLALGFLLWGARAQLRSWRIGSLALMVIAVLKVFLVDAAGLGGLARIASFMALGFSLIGIGWFYSRQLRAPAKDGGTTVT